MKICMKCDGFMVSETLLGESYYWLYCYRCINCGTIVYDELKIKDDRTNLCLLNKK